MANTLTKKRDDKLRWDRRYRAKVKEDPKYKRDRYKSVKRWRSRHPDKNAAYFIVMTKLKNGELEKHECMCGRSDVKANYTNYIDIEFVFLCPDCTIEFNRCRIDADSR